MFTTASFSHTITLDGIEITGNVLWCFINDVEVELTSPYAGIRAGLHTTLWVNSPATRNLDDENGISEKGYRTIATCLEITYREADFLYRNREVLHDRIARCEREVAEATVELENLKSAFAVENSLRKKQLRRKELSQKEYGAFRREYRDKLHSMEWTIGEIYRSIYSGYPEHRVRYGDEKQDIAFVKKYFA